MSAQHTPEPVFGWRTWGDKNSRCAHCCNGDRCDDPSHYDRTSKPGCPHCLNTGYALWTEAGRIEQAEHEARYAKATGQADQGAAMVDQQFLHSETSKGDCFRACIATILSMPIQAVPHFALLDFGPDIFVAMECAMAWLNSKGYEMWMNIDDGEDPLPLCVVSGISLRGVAHAVVGDTATGAVVHDPHPSRAGLSHISHRLYLFPKPTGSQP